MSISTETCPFINLYTYIMNQAKTSSSGIKNSQSSLDRANKKNTKSSAKPEKKEMVTDEKNIFGQTGQVCQVLMFLSKRVTEAASPAEIISDDTPCMDVMDLLEKYGVLLVSKKYEVVGMITDMSLIKNLTKKDFEKLTAADLLQTLETIDTSKSVKQAISDMEEKNVPALAVTSKSAIFGILTATDLIKFLAKWSKSEIYPQEDIIETKIDEFLALVRQGPINIKDVEKALGVKQDQIENWIDVLENQNIMKIERRFGKLIIKDERKI
jgi:signal-transduction protein with cAMP-binding, CBS, and nucleotidyltransferase domain